jgi:hypothetical protein
MTRALSSARTASRNEARLTPFVLAAAVAAAFLGGIAAASHPALLVIPFAFGLLALLWKRPYVGVLILLAAATLIEQFGYTIGSHPGAFTDNVAFFRVPAHGVIASPAEMLIIAALLVWIMRSGLRRSLNLPRSPLARCMCVLWGFLLVGMAVGISGGGQFRFALWELRPWILLSATYLLAATLLTTRKALDAVLWTLVLGTGFKALQGTWIFFSFARHMQPRPEQILGHEEAFFFCVFIVITVGLWLYGLRGPLRATATGLLPFVVIADLANARRTAWLVLIAALVVLLVVAHSTLPQRRPVIRAFAVAMLMGSAVYLPVYWHGTGTAAQPARAIRSQFQPDARDESSDLYRKQENVNLLLNIKASGLKGRGFGIPIDYSISIADISSIDSMIAYIPHNGLLWVWLRLGMQGEIAFWCLIAAAMIRACRLATARDPRLAHLGAVVCCSVVAYVLIGYNDLGLGYFRIAVAMGCLLGTLEAAARFAEAPEIAPASVATEPAARVPATTDH